MREVISGIYCIENLLNGKKYVGMSKDVNDRMNSNHKTCKILYQAIKKYGKENFKRYIIEYCDKDKLLDREEFWIKEFHSLVTEWGYNNLPRGAVCEGGWHHKESAKEKIREFRIGKHLSDTAKEKVSKSHSGKSHYAFGKKKENSSSRFFGVFKDSRKDGHVYWKAGLILNRKFKNIKECKTEIDAAKAYNEYIIKNSLPNPLNNIDIPS